MSESYVECLVKGRPNTKAKLLMILCIILAAAAFIAMFLLGGKWWLFIIVIGFVVGIYFSSQYTRVEYEYLYVDKELVIDKIYNESRRKRVATYSFDKIQVIAPVGSRHLDNFGKLSTNPKDFSAVDDSQGGKYVMFFEGQEQVLISPNEALVKIMKNAAPRKVYSE